MAFRFTKASCVAVGAFNIYIVQPQWLTGKGLIPPGMVDLEAKMDEPGFRFRSPQQKLQWQITPSRIVIETDDFEEDCGSMMARLLELLPETPVTAIGNNTHYEEPLDVVEDIPHPGFPTEFPDVEPLPGFALHQRSFHTGVLREDCLYNVQVSLTAKRAELSTNVHCQVPGGTLAKERARRFLEHRVVGIELARHHLKVTVDV